jgi:hypothetical protein
MVNIDKSQVPQKKANAEMHPLLPNFVAEVALVKPTCDFYVDDDCIHSKWRRKDDSRTEDFQQIYKVKVRQDGEEIGFLSIVGEYRNGASVDVYGVGSFRIDKARGRHDETTTKDLKVALRNVKKFLVGRDYTEIANLIKQTVTNKINVIVQRAESRIRWCISTDNLALSYSLLSYQARKDGVAEVKLPAISKEFMRNMQEMDENIVSYIEANALQEMHENKKGYGLSLYSTGSCALYDFATDSVRRYKSTTDLPDAIQTRLAMFKVIDKDEPHSQFGCKFDGDMYFIVSGELQMQS